MRVACVRVPSFVVAVEQRASPALARRPLVVLDRGAVLDGSPELGSVRQRSLRQAKALYSHATFVEANHVLYREVFDAMLDALERVAPFVEAAQMPGCAFADVAGLAGHYDDEFALAGSLADAVQDATRLLPSIGIASGKSVALTAASVADPGDAIVVLPGREREFVEDKSVAILPVTPDLVQRLERLALRTLGDIAALPRPAFEAQFGRAQGCRLWELANGIDAEPLCPRRPEQLCTERLTFDAPVVASEALVAAAKQIVKRLSRLLDGRTARRLHIQLLAEERIVWERLEAFREPTGDEARMLLVLKTRLQSLELPQAIDTITVTLSGIGRELAKQVKLFTDSQQNLNQIGEAIRQLRARYGRDVVGRVMQVDPWSRHPEERNVLVPYDA
jgi:nucleotidyltransferase/DNA polymerase involved in DNA repair